MTEKTSKLEKLIIEAYANPDFSKKPTASFSLQINPQRLNHNFFKAPAQVGILANGAAIADSKPNDYNQQLDFSFYLDTTGVVPVPNGLPSDIPSMIDALRKICVEVDGKTHTPPYLKVRWGEQLAFTCTLDSMNIEYLLWTPSGVPIRARVAMSFNRFIDPATKSSIENTSSPDLTHVYTFKDGDSLPNLCKTVYGDKKYYIQVAEANQLVSFRDIPAGTQLTFPPLN